MIRNVYIQRKVLELYQKMSNISYPIHPQTVLPYISKDCRILTYQKMAQIAGCSVEDIIILCKSRSGATHFDPDSNRYLILYNADMNTGRIRWTLTHEIGHVYLGHLDTMGGKEIAYTEQREFFDQFENEADFFTWNLLAPLPIMREMSIQSTTEVKSVYGLSTQAAALQYDRYIKWCKSHIKTAWENNMLREFREKHNKNNTIV